MMAKYEVEEEDLYNFDENGLYDGRVNGGYARRWIDVAEPNLSSLAVTENGLR